MRRGRCNSADYQYGAYARQAGESPLETQFTPLVHGPLMDP